MQSLSFLADHFMDYKQHRILASLALPSPFFLFLLLIKMLQKMRGRTSLIYASIAFTTLFYLFVWAAVIHSFDVLKQADASKYIGTFYFFAGTFCILAFIEEMHPSYWFKTDAKYLAAHPIPPADSTIVSPYPTKIFFFAYWIRVQLWVLLLMAIQTFGAFVLFGYNMMEHPIWKSILLFFIVFWIMIFLQGVVFPKLCKCPNCQRPFFPLAHIYKTLIGFNLVKAILKTHQFQCPTCSARYTVDSNASRSNLKP